MKGTIRNNINSPYTLHDMNVIAFEVTGNDSVDNLYALSALLDVSMDDIIVSRTIQLDQYKNEQQAATCCSAFSLFVRLFWIRQRSSLL